MTEKKAWEILESDLANCHKHLRSLIDHLKLCDVTEQGRAKIRGMERTADEYCKHVYQDVDLLKNTKWDK